MFNLTNPNFNNLIKDLYMPLSKTPVMIPINKNTKVSQKFQTFFNYFSATDVSPYIKILKFLVTYSNINGLQLFSIFFNFFQFFFKKSETIFLTFWLILHFLAIFTKINTLTCTQKIPNNQI